MVCKSRLAIPRVDSIQEDANGILWVFSFGREKKIFEFSPKLTLLTHYCIESDRDISKRIEPTNVYRLGTYEWSDPTAISLDNKTIYYPSGNGRIGYFTVNDDPEIPPTFGFAYDKFSELEIFYCVSNFS